MSATGIKTLPRFMGEGERAYFTLQFSGWDKPKAHIVFIPPFGEEMNRCRELVAGQARSFAVANYACTLIDFYGTGDSQGELCEASLQDWHDNIRLTIDTLQGEENVPIILWGFRLGGFIAMDFAAKNRADIQDIILWQPVTAGKMYVNQVLRQRVASLMVKDLPAETTKEIRQRLQEGEKVEVAGYTLGGTLIGDIEGIALTAMSSVCTGKIAWLEHVIEQGKEPGVASQRALEKLRNQDNTIEMHTFTGPQIWQIHERDFAPELLSATDDLLP